MPVYYSRHSFLKLAATFAASLVARPAFPIDASTLGLGRTTRGINAFEDQNETTHQTGFYPGDSVLTLLEEKVPGEETRPNRTWYRVEKGWVHSGQIQPVRNELNDPLDKVPEHGFVAEVTVPYTQAWHNDANGQVHLAYRFYYSTNHWVDKLFFDHHDTALYRVIDDRYQVHYYVLAEHLRRVPASGLTPLAPKVTDKRIEIDLAKQQLRAYENGREVLTTLVATGRQGVETPKGEFQIERKRPSRHMAAGDANGNGFDLPGVPWVSYFYWTGVALHGTYWHNDYGTPRSRGCANLLPNVAKWLYRWTWPVAPADQQLVREANGTQVIVF